MKILRTVPRLVLEHDALNVLLNLRRSQWLSRTVIEKLQLFSLKRLLKYAYENVPFYHFLMKSKNIKPDDIKSINDLRKIPILKRKDIRENMVSLISPSYPRSNLFFTHTSGSTGEPLLFVRSKESETYAKAAYYRFLEWYGWKIGDYVAKIWAFPHMSKEKLFMQRLFSLVVNNELLLNSLGMQLKDVLRFVKLLILYKPKIITGYTSALLYMSRLIEKYNLLSEINYDWVAVNQAEMLHDFEKDVISKGFRANVYNFYGSREIPSIASSCPISDRLHINSENRIVEIIRDDEDVNNEFGKIIITNLNEYAMPLIRYEIGDLGEKSIDMCSCGRGLHSLVRIHGRTSDTLLVNGKIFSFPSFRSIFENLPIIRYQIIQKSESEISVFITPLFSVNLNKVESAIKERFRKLLGKDLIINVIFVDEILPTSTGKHKYVIRSTSG